MTGRQSVGADPRALGTFVAKPAPVPVDETRRWAAQQFRELEAIIREQAAVIADLQAIVGDGSWDG